VAIDCSTSFGGERSEDPMERSTRAGPPLCEVVSLYVCLAASLRAKTPLPSALNRLEVGIQEGLKLGLSDRPFVPRHQLPITEQNQRGNPLNLVRISR